MAQDSIIHVVRIANPAQCHCDSLHNVISNITASSNATNCCDVVSTLIICITVLLVVLFVIGVLVYSSNKQGVSKDVLKRIEKLEEQIIKKVDK